MSELLCLTDPCEGCGIESLSAAVREEAALTVEAVLDSHTQDEIRGANALILYSWIAEGSQFEGGFNVNEPIEFDFIFGSLRKITGSDCPSRGL